MMENFINIKKRNCVIKQSKVRSLSKDHMCQGKQNQKDMRDDIFKFTLTAPGSPEINNVSFEKREKSANSKLSFHESTLKQRGMSILRPILPQKSNKLQITSESGHKMAARRTKQSQTMLINHNNQLQMKVQMFIQSLKDNFILSQSHFNSYSIQKEIMAKVILKIYLHLLQDEDGSIVGRLQIFPFLNEHLQGLQKLVRGNNYKIKKGKSEIVKQVTLFCHSNQEYHKQIGGVETAIKNVIRQKQNKQMELEQLQQKKRQTIKQKSFMEQRYVEMEKNYDLLKEQNQKESIKLSEILKKIEEKQIFLVLVEEQSEKILNFVNSQTNNKIVVMASDYYKDIQAQIYDFASYLQCNQLASSLTYEPLPFLCLSQGVESKLKDVNRTILQQQNLSIEQKLHIMRDFLMESIQKFRKKDNQQQNLLLFKTKCIRSFIQKMKKWLDNWTLKQEYLVKLRNEFGIDSRQFTAQLNSLSSNITENIFQEKKKELMQLYVKIQQNYKMGNSFY